MKKYGKISLVLIIISLFFCGNSTMLVVGPDRYEYEDASQKIYEQIDSFIFTFDTTELNYAIIFAAMFIKFDDVTSHLVSDVFVITLTEYYVSVLTATLTYNASFFYGLSWYNTSGVGVDTSSLMQSSNLIYNYTIVSAFPIINDLFPVNLFVVFEYTLTSSEFSESGTYMTNNTFTLKSPKSGPEIPGYMMSVLLTTTVGVLIIVVIYKKRNKNLDN